MLELTFLLIFLCFSSGQGNPHIAIFKCEEDCGNLIATHAEVTNDAEVSFVCQVLDKGLPLQDQTLWKRKTRKRTEMTKTFLNFTRITADDQGEYFCVCVKYKLLKIITIIVKPGAMVENDYVSYGDEQNANTGDTQSDYEVNYYDQTYNYYMYNYDPIIIDKPKQTDPSKLLLDKPKQTDRSLRELFDRFVFVMVVSGSILTVLMISYCCILFWWVQCTELLNEYECIPSKEVVNMILQRYFTKHTEVPLKTSSSSWSPVLALSRDRPSPSKERISSSLPSELVMRASEQSSEKVAPTSNS